VTGNPVLTLREAIEPWPKDVVRPGVQQREPQHPIRVALHVAKTKEAAVVVADQIEPLHTERVGQRADPLHLGVVEAGWFGPPETRRRVDPHFVQSSIKFAT
jgi:hypothetical protein